MPLGVALEANKPVETSYELVHNDIGEPVRVWWQLPDPEEEFVSLAPDFNSHQYLDPGSTTGEVAVAPSIMHQVCIKTNLGIQGARCKEVWSPKVADDHVTYQVSDIFEQGIFPPNKWDDIGALESELSVSEQHGSHVHYCVPGLLALLTFIGIQNFRSLQKPMEGLREPLIKT